MSAAAPSEYRRFFANPVVGLVGSIASLLGLVLAVYFYMSARNERKLVYLVHPAKAVVVGSQQLGDFRILFKDKVITSEVTAAQVAVWNAGTESIRPMNMLKPLQLKVEPAAQILEASIRKTSRPEVVHLSLDRSDADKGVVTLAWDILEPNDGGVIQLIFAAAPSAEIHVTAVVEGQGDPRRLTFGGARIQSVEKQLESARWIRLLAIGYALLGVLMGTRGAMRLMRRKRRTGGLVFLALGAVMVAAGIAFYFWSTTTAPPFGFE